MSQVYKMKKKNLWKTITAVLLVLLALAGIMCAIFLFMRMNGKSALFGKKADAVPDLQAVHNSETQKDGTGSGAADSAEPPETPEQGTLRYKNKTYRYNSDIITLLLLGIDKRGDIESAYTAGKGGQADTIILAVLDTKNKKISFISVSRETMTEIELYSVFGDAVCSETAQLALSYAYGGDPQKSCELTETAVSKLFYNLPIHGYFTLNESAIQVLNDMVGGVTLTLLDDFSAQDASMTKGASITLSGKQAELYIRGRMELSDGTNESRMKRQRQYMNAFIDKAVLKLKADAALPLTVYNAVRPYAVTDLSINEMLFIASEAVKYGFSIDNVYTVAGTSKDGDKFSEFYVDETALYELILSVFYDCVG
jgi:LCP family protein required for cell wall assembly